MAYTWIAFYEGNQFAREVPGGKPPHALHDLTGGPPLRMTSLQLYDHRGRAFTEQLFDVRQRPITTVIDVGSPDQAGTVPCHIIGWQETAYDAARNPVNVRHLAHIVEDGRIIMTPAPADASVFTRARRRLKRNTRPYTWAAVYDDISLPPALYQFDPETDVEVSGEHIDRARLKSLILTDEDGDPWVEQIFAPGQRVVYRRRIEQPVNSRRPIVVFLLGWQVTVRDDADSPLNLQHISYTFQQNGTTIMGGRFDDTDPFFHGLDWVPADDGIVGTGGAHRTGGITRDR
jgi:hypothetical protein